MEQIKNNSIKFDVIVVGAGISGSAAAYECASNNLKTLLINISMDNPAFLKYSSKIDLFNKENLLLELFSVKNIFKESVINNFEGVYCSKEDKIDYYIINKKKFSLYIKSRLENKNNLYTRQGLVTEIKKNNDNNFSVFLNDGESYSAKAIIISCGTFLNSIINYGAIKKEAGRLGEISSKSLYKSLSLLNIRFNKISTFINPIICLKSGQDNIFSSIAKINKTQVEELEKNNKFLLTSYIKKKNIKIFKYVKNSSLFNEKEEMFNNFMETNFIPEDTEAKCFYVENLKFKFDQIKQFKELDEIHGLKDSYFLTENYKIDYECLSAGQLNNMLESRLHRGLFFAGGINASEGYEESAIQGYIAGRNASFCIKHNNAETNIKYGDPVKKTVDYINNQNRKEPFSYIDIEK